MVLIDGIHNHDEYLRRLHTIHARECVKIAVRQAFEAALDGEPEDDVRRRIQPAVHKAVQSTFLLAVMDHNPPGTVDAAISESYAIVDDLVEAKILAEVEVYIEDRLQTAAHFEVQPVVQGIFQVLVHDEVIASAVPPEAHYHGLGDDMSTVVVGAVIALQGLFFWAIMG